jgi:hypothetical protein
MISRCYFLLFLFCLAWTDLSYSQSGGPTTSASDSTTQVYVYRLTFTNKTGNVNFRSYQGGYYVCDVFGTKGTLVLTQVLGNVRSYYTYTNFGQVFAVTKAGERRAVMVGSLYTGPSGSQATSSVTSAVTNMTLYAMGEAEETKAHSFSFGEATLSYAKELKGYGIFCDSQEDLPFVLAAGTDTGSSGVVDYTMTFDEGQTETAQTANMSVTEATAKVVEQLTEQKYINGLATGSIPPR